MSTLKKYCQNPKDIGTTPLFPFHSNRTPLPVHLKRKVWTVCGFKIASTYIAFLMSMVPSDFAPSTSVSWYVRILSLSTNHRRFQLRLKDKRKTYNTLECCLKIIIKTWEIFAKQKLFQSKSTLRFIRQSSAFVIMWELTDKTCERIETNLFQKMVFFFNLF